MIPIPNGRLVSIFILPLLLFIAGFYRDSLFAVAIWCNCLILVVALFDIVITLYGLNYGIVFEKVKPFSIGRLNTINLNLINVTRKKFVTFVKLGLPHWIEDQTEAKAIKMGAMSQQCVIFLLRPTRRGSFEIKSLYLRICSKLGLFYFDKNENVNVSVDVYPDIKRLNHFLKLTRNNRDYKMGIDKTRWLGAGTELESLREYQKDDDSKFIDWKASTRLNRPISKMFQMETNNQVTIALDCGRLMTAEQYGLSTLDYAINSLLILSHIAFNAGDSLSVVAFSDRVIGEISQLKGRDSLKKITPFITKLEPEFVESNYLLLFDYLQQTQKKRSLVILITDMLDDINYELFKKRISWLSRRHFVLLILMQDNLLSLHANQKTTNLNDLYVKAASREMILQRNNAISKLRHYNVNVLDVLPQELTGPLINKYLELKMRNLL